MPDITFKGQLSMRRGYKDEEHKLTGGSFFIRRIRDEDLGIFFNPSFINSLYKKYGIKRMTPAEFEMCEAEITIKFPDKFLEKKNGNKNISEK